MSTFTLASDETTGTVGEGNAIPPGGVGDGSAAGETTDTDEPPLDMLSTDSAEEKVMPPPETGVPLKSPPAMGAHALTGPAQTGANYSQAQPSAAARTLVLVERRGRLRLLSELHRLQVRPSSRLSDPDRGGSRSRHGRHALGVW